MNRRFWIGGPREFVLGVWTVFVIGALLFGFAVWLLG